MRLVCCAIAIFVCVATAVPCFGQQPQRPYRLESVDLKQPVIWGAEVRGPEDGGLAFGGQDQNADDGRPHTRIRVDGQWRPIHQELRDGNPLQALHALTWKRRGDAQSILALARFTYFKGLSGKEEAAAIESRLAPRLAQFRKDLETLFADLPGDSTDHYIAGQVDYARRLLEATVEIIPPAPRVISADMLGQLHAAQVNLELAAEALDAEPPPRAIDCGAPRKQNAAAGPLGNALVYDTKTKLYVLFGGDHFDYLTNDLWVFSLAQRRWMQRHTEGAPPPRANHRLEAKGDGTLRMSGGYTYASNTDYCGGQYLDLDDGPWVLDIESCAWSPADGNPSQLVAPNSRVYRTGPFHPDFYLQGEKPDAARFEAWLKKLPANEWVATDPPRRPRLNRDWGTARIDTDRDMMLRWSGGHSAHGGTDVPHFHFSTNRWELPFPVEFPLGQLYSNTSYPSGFNFNLRPWITGHTYQNYAYDPPSKKMVMTGRPRHYYVYDPDLADWIGRGRKPNAMQYNSCFYTLTLTATPNGAVCWDAHGKVHRFDHEQGRWIELETTGDTLPGAYVDNSSICYDANSDRVLIINTAGYGTPYNGQVWALDMKTYAVTALSPGGMQGAGRLANVDRCCYDKTHNLILMGTFLKDAGPHTPTPAYDCAKNRWVTLDLKYAAHQRNGRTTRAFPHGRSDGLMFDPRRELIWGVDTNGQIYVLRLDPKSANLQPLE